MCREELLEFSVKIEKVCFNLVKEYLLMRKEGLDISQVLFFRIKLFVLHIIILCWTR
mgnify:CR=1 FL=1|jgi:hypothetical protein